MYRDTVTLFNCKRGSDGDTWYPTVLTGVNLNKDKGAVIKQYGAESADNSILFVKYQNDGQIKVGNNVWLPPKEWQALADPTGYITFDPDGDFFCDGIWTGTASDHGDQSFYEWMLSHYDFVYAITSVNYLSVIPHFEVTGR